MEATENDQTHAHHCFPPVLLVPTMTKLVIVSLIGVWWGDSEETAFTRANKSFSDDLIPNLLQGSTHRHNALSTIVSYIAFTMTVPYNDAFRAFLNC